MLWLLSSYTGERLIYAFVSDYLNIFSASAPLIMRHMALPDSVYRIQHDAASVKLVRLMRFAVRQGLLPLERTGGVDAADRCGIRRGRFDDAKPVLLFTHRCGRRLRQQWTDVKSTETATVACAQEV